VLGGGQKLAKEEWGWGKFPHTPPKQVALSIYKRVEDRLTCSKSHDQTDREFQKINNIYNILSRKFPTSGTFFWKFDRGKFSSGLEV
jgi:hypothetical protein